MILFIYNIQNRYIYRDRKQIVSCQGLGGEKVGQELLHRGGALLWSDANVSELDGGSSDATL